MIFTFQVPGEERPPGEAEEGPQEAEDNREHERGLCHQGVAASCVQGTKNCLRALRQILSPFAEGDKIC